MNASFSLMINRRRWLVVLLLAVSLATPVLMSYQTNKATSTLIARQTQQSGPKESFGG